MILKHYSLEDNLVFDRNYDYSHLHERYDKPRGFWVSVSGPDDWKSWCEEEEFRVEALKNEYDVVLKTSASILYVTSYLDIISLSTQDKGPDWRSIMNEFDGIVIAPYSWTARHEFMWYYSWDCASGCIWNLHAIQSVRKANDKTRQQRLPV